jgi:hypothetical protein
LHHTELNLGQERIHRDQKATVSKTQTITTVGESPEQERKTRMVKYVIAMIIRVICIVAALFVDGWLMLLCFAGAIFLPYFAVVIANAQVSKPGTLNQVTPNTRAITADPLDR